MGKESTGKLISVKGASLVGVSSDQALCGLDPNLASLVRPGVVGSGDPVDNAPPLTELLHHL